MKLNIENPLRIGSLTWSRHIVEAYTSSPQKEECYKNGHKSYHSRSSIFRILNKYGVKHNRGKHFGPIKKKSERVPKTTKES